MLIFWCILGGASGLLLGLAFRKNGREGALRAAVLLLAAAVLVAADQAVKAWARAVLQPAGTMPFIPYVLQLRFVLNTGAAFSMLAGRQLFLTGFTGLALIALGGYLVLYPPQKRLEYAGWVLILAGGIGNLIDRVANGEVVDLFEPIFMEFAVFNVADICITVGCCLLFLFYLLTELSNRKKSGGSEPAAQAAGSGPDAARPDEPAGPAAEESAGQQGPASEPDARGQDETA